MLDCTGEGRLGNKIFRNLYGYLFSKKFGIDLHIDDLPSMKALGLDLVSVQNTINKIPIFDNDCDRYLKQNKLPNKNYRLAKFCQTPYVSKCLYEYFRNKENKLVQSIIQNNKYKENYGKNNDVFIHVRQGDIINTEHTAPLNYFENALSSIHYEKGYIASDTLSSQLCQTLIKKYDLIPIELNEIDTILFASTNKHIILSPGTFSYFIGLFAFFSETIIYCNPTRIKKWHGDIFQSTNWICL